LRWNPGNARYYAGSAIIDGKVVVPATDGTTTLANVAAPACRQKSLAAFARRGE